MEMIDIATADYYGSLAERRFEAYRQRRKAQGSALVWAGFVGAVLVYGLVKQGRVR